MKRRIPAIFLVISFIVILATACGDDISERQPGDSARALFITQSDASQKFSWEEFVRLQEEFSIEVEMVSGDNDTAAEIDGIERAISEEYDVIFINSSDITAVIPALTRAKEAGIIVGLFSSGLPQGHTGENVMNFFCGSDYFLSGMTAGELVSSHFPYGANAVGIGGPENDAVHVQLHNGFSAGIASNINMLATENNTGYLSVNESRQIMEEFLKEFGNDINIVWCHRDEYANGAIEAVQEANRNDIFIIGVGGTGTGFRNVRDGLQALSIAQNYSSMARRSLQNARTLLDGGSVPEVNIIPMEMITLDTIDNFITPDW